MKLKTWLIHRLGLYTKYEVEDLLNSFGYTMKGGGRYPEKRSAQQVYTQPVPPDLRDMEQFGFPVSNEPVELFNVEAVLDTPSVPFAREDE